MHAVHQFFSNRQFFHVDTPITTRNDCEGGGETFSISDTDFYDGQVFLQVSSQLHLEALCRGLSNVYTIAPTFRAESSLSRFHLSEFKMIEAEMAFVETLPETMEIAEQLVRHLAKALSPFSEDVNICRGVFATKQGDEKVNDLLSLCDNPQPFPRITYEEAVEIIEEQQSASIGDQSLGKRHELILVSHFQSPVFVTHFPSRMKPFYMKQTDCGRYAGCSDLLAPTSGEIIGGSVREAN